LDKLDEGFINVNRKENLADISESQVPPKEQKDQ